VPSGDSRKAADKCFGAVGMSATEKEGFREESLASIE
jgi:hypothetical protein